MHLTTILATSLLGLTTALPTASPKPIFGTSKGFNLRVNLLDPTRDLRPSIKNTYLSDQRVGTGFSITVLSTSPTTTWYLNGTAYHTTVTHDIPNVYPLSLQISGPTQFDFLYPTEHAIGTVVNGGTELGLRAGEPILFPNYGDSYAVCKRDFIFGGSKTKILTARYIYENETVPEDCAPVEFQVVCATLDDLPQGASWNHDSVFSVPCWNA